MGRLFNGFGRSPDLFDSLEGKLTDIAAFTSSFCYISFMIDS